MTKDDLINFELRVKEAWEAGKIMAPVHFCGGNEEQLIEIFKEIKSHDYIFSSHRNHYHAILHGVEPDSLFAEIMGAKEAICGGNARSMGFISTQHNFYSSAIVGGCCAMAVGTAWALKQVQENFKADPLSIDEFAVKPPERHVWCFVGDGAVDGGHFWEALHYAVGQDLPITFIIENNDRATCTSIVDRMGEGYTLLRFDGQRNYKDLERKIWVYYYEPTYPHVGTGKYVQF